MPSLPAHLRARAGSVWCLIFSCGLLTAVSAASLPAESATTTDSSASPAANQPAAEPVSLDAARQQGRERSGYLLRKIARPTTQPEADIATWRQQVRPVLLRACLDCHGPDAQEGNVRVDTLDPDLLQGDDVSWWLEVQSVLSKGEMPPPDAEPITATERTRIVDWLAKELLTASQVRRAEHGDTAFRRMTRDEYNYALQDLLGEPFDFASDLPPDPRSEDGFRNSAEMLHMSSVQLQTYRRIARVALDRVTVRGNQPAPLYWSVSMNEAAADSWTSQQQQLDKLRAEQKDNPELDALIEKREQEFRQPHRAAHYRQRQTGQTARVEWRYHKATYAWSPTEQPAGEPQPADSVVVIPPGQHLIVELGNRVPTRGQLQVTVLAARAAGNPQQVPELELQFGWQASNDSSASVRVSPDNAVVTAEDAPELHQWRVPLCEISPRNLVRTTGEMGDLPSPSEYIRLVNPSLAGDVHVHHVNVTTPVYSQWPPAAHRQLFPEDDGDELSRMRRLLTQFLPRAWRRPVTTEQIERKVRLFSRFRPHCDDFEDAAKEVLATVLSSPAFLYLNAAAATGDAVSDVPTARTSQHQLASRLSFFLWSSVPDNELRQLAETGSLHGEILEQQITRLLADRRSQRFSRLFVRQWLGLQLLDYLNVDRKAHPRFRAELKEAMQTEPVALFTDILQHDRSVIDFIHCDYTFVNEKLARHYGLSNVVGTKFQRVSLQPADRRGGLLTQGGLLAMNSDGKDSHPLKRGIWVLENLLNDPPPPPPPAVPVIDVADPRIAKMTLKERIENHRQQPACLSCHQRIDPWGIAFENYDAVGAWRETVAGQPVDASSQLFNQQVLDGPVGLKRYLLLHRQDQFVRALTHKMLTYALGRPLTFADRRHVDSLATQLRQQGDGLATLVRLIVLSDAFQTL